MKRAQFVSFHMENGIVKSCSILHDLAVLCFISHGSVKATGSYSTIGTTTKCSMIDGPIFAIVHDEHNAVGPDHESYKTCKCEFARITRQKMSEIDSTPVQAQNDQTPAEVSNEIQPLPEVQSQFERNQIKRFAPLIDVISKAKEILNGNTMMNEEDKKSRRIALFNSRKIFASEMVSKTENGNDYSKLIDHIQFLEEFIKDVKTIHQAYDLARLVFVQNANIEERARIAEEDKKYKPKFAEREAVEKVKMTESEKKIKNLVKAGLSREVAEKIIFGTA